MKTSILPRGPLVDDKGFMTEAWRKYFSNDMSNNLIYLSDEGYLLPRVDASTSTKTGVNNRGIIFYDNSQNRLVVNINGTLKAIQVTDL